MEKEMKHTAFMVMPFSDETVKSAYENCIQPLFEKKRIQIRKADEIFSTNPVYDDIVTEIKESDFVIVDISGKNPNVFYELGVAHTLKQKQTIILTHEDYGGTPFDIAHFRIIQYSDSLAGSTQLEKHLGETVDYILNDDNLVRSNEFELLETSLLAADQAALLLGLLAVFESGGMVSRFEKFSVKGFSPAGKNESSSISAAWSLKAFLKIGYMSAKGDNIILEPKGKAFGEYLKEHGYYLAEDNETKANKTGDDNSE